MFLTSLKQTCNEYMIKFSENQSAPKLENRKTSPFSPCAPNLLHVLISRIPGYHNLCSPGSRNMIVRVGGPQRIAVVTGKKSLRGLRLTVHQNCVIIILVSITIVQKCAQYYIGLAKLWHRQGKIILIKKIFFALL